MEVVSDSLGYLVSVMDCCKIYKKLYSGMIMRQASCESVCVDFGMPLVRETVFSKKKKDTAATNSTTSSNYY